MGGMPGLCALYRWYNPTHRDEQPYSKKRYDALSQKYGTSDSLNKYETIFLDSITVAGRLCFQWCFGQKDYVETSNNKTDTRKVYVLHGQEMIVWLTHLQHLKQEHLVCGHSGREIR